SATVARTRRGAHRRRSTASPATTEPRARRRTAPGHRQGGDPRHGRRAVSRTRLPRDHPGGARPTARTVEGDRLRAFRLEGGPRGARVPREADRARSRGRAPPSAAAEGDRRAADAAARSQSALKYFAAGWWKTSAETEASGSIM